MRKLRCLMAMVTAVVVVVTGSVMTASADPRAMRTSTDEVLSSVLREVPGLKDLQIPEKLANLPGGLPNDPMRDYGTPTRAPGKVCPFVGKIPVSLPVATSPVGTSIPGLAGLNLSRPSVDSKLYGELCMSEQALAEARAGNPPSVLVLNHGITYGAWYWDFPFKPAKYSTVNYLNKHGYATLNIDRLGVGRSDHPLSPLVNAQAQAEVVHQLIQKLKSGHVGDIKFGHVGLVGHSYGTVINWLESAMYNDTAINIGTGYSSRINPVTAGSFIGMSTPALASPITHDQPWAIDPGYLQPLPAARDLPQLYHKPNAEPGVIRTDTALANTVTVGEIATFPARGYDGTYKNIRIPTFSIQGEKDIMTCGNNARMCATEATTTDGPMAVERASQRYTKWQGTAMNSQSCFRGASIPQASHNVALHRNAKQFQRQVLFFANQSMGPDGKNIQRYRETCAKHGPTVFDSLPELNRLVPPFPVAPPPLGAITGPISETLRRD